MLILFSFLRTRIFKNFPRRHVCLLELEEGVFKPRETRWIFQGGFSHLRPIRRDDQRGPWPPLKLFDVGIWADCLAKPLSGAGLAAALSENLPFLLSILPENYC